MNLSTVTDDYDEVIRGIKRALTLRNRYTVLFYFNDRGYLERYAEYAAKKHLAAD